MRYLTRKHLSRRTMLRGAGVAVGLPLLESMIPAGMRRASAAGLAPVRLGFVYLPHGAVMARFTPAGEGRDFTLGPIEHHSELGWAQRGVLLEQLEQLIHN